MWQGPMGNDLISAGDDRITLSEAEKESIREQLNRLLASPYFIQSKRSVTFLRFITDHTLAGDTEKIKERILGIEIFGRDAAYDTASDPVVRVTASEIRKRVAQYYQESGHQDELQITLPSGSYIPRFHWPKDSHNWGLQTSGLHAEPRPTDPGILERDHLHAAHADAPPAPAQDFAPALPDSSSHAGVDPEAPVVHRRRHFKLASVLTSIVAGLLLVGLVFVWRGIH